MNHPVPAGFDALPMLDLRNPNFTVEGNQLLAELRAKGSLCRVEPLGSLGFLRWADCDKILRDFRTFSAAFEQRGYSHRRRRPRFNHRLGRKLRKQEAGGEVAACPGKG
jgi:hypothetical protein